MSYLAGRLGTLRPLPGDHINGLIRGGPLARLSYIAISFDSVHSWRMENARLTLKDAIESGRLDDFIAQAEEEGVGLGDAVELEDALRRVITSPQGSRPASRSPDADGSPGK